MVGDSDDDQLVNLVPKPPKVKEIRNDHTLACVPKPANFDEEQDMRFALQVDNDQRIEDEEAEEEKNEVEQAIDKV